jgi:hypothetical protein
MKFYAVIIIVIIFFSSCLKESIPDAMLGSKNSEGTTATMSYEVNGNAVNITVDNADNQDTDYYILGCSKLDYYSITGLSDSGEFVFVFYTTNLTVGNYKYTGAFGDFYMLHYWMNDYVHARSDSMSLNITSYTNGHISGNFSGILTPMLDESSQTFGTPSSVLITNGVFKNVPVFN